MPERREGEIAAIFERLKAEVRSRPPAAGGDRTRQVSRSLPARSRAERAWAVTAERPFEQPATRRGRVQRYVVVPVKQVLRKLMRWYVEPLAADQRSFNLAVLNLVDELAEQFEADLSRLERRLDKLQEAREPDCDDPGG